MPFTTIVVNTTDIPNTCPQGYEYSLTGNANDWQASNIFLNIPTGQTYIVRVRDKCNGCVYSSPTVVDTPEDFVCECTSSITNGVVPNQPINTCIQDVNILLQVLVFPNACCLEDGEVPIRLITLPPLPAPYQWSAVTTALFNATGFIEVATVAGVAVFNLFYDRGVPVNGDAAVIPLLFTGCGCNNTPTRVDIFFDGC